VRTFTKEDLDKIKDFCGYHFNNCGGCEICSQVFGNEVIPYDFEEAYSLVNMIEELQAKVTVLETTIGTLEERLEDIKNDFNYTYDVD